MTQAYCDLTDYSVDQCQNYDDSEFDDEPDCQKELANQASCQQTA